MRKIDTIVIHHSGNTDTVKKIRKLHVDINGWDDVGYHFMISRNGEIIKGRDLETEGAHVLGFNKNSIGICLLGNFDEEILENKQKHSLIKLLRKLTKDFNLAKDNIKFHRDFLNVTKSCPGKNINMELISGLKIKT